MVFLLFLLFPNIIIIIKLPTYLTTTLNLKLKYHDGIEKLTEEDNIIYF